MNRREINDRILNALLNSKYKWRTARGISKETDIQIDKDNLFLH